MEEENLTSMQDIVNEKKAQMLKEDYDRYKPMYDVIGQYLREVSLVMYGGTALNELLPKKDRFYEKYELPDFDVLTIAAKKHAVGMAQKLHQHGYKYVEVKEGVHPGTYKVFSEFKNVADVTKMSKPIVLFLKRLAAAEKSKSAEGWTIAPPVFLMWSLYKELARPYSSIHRWEKILDRYQRFYKHFAMKKTKPPRSARDPIQDPNVETITQKLLEYIKKEKYPLMGMFAANLYMKQPLHPHPYFPRLEILAEEYVKVADEIVKAIQVPPGYKLVKIHRRSFDNKWYMTEMIGRRMKIGIKKINEDKIHMLLTVHSPNDHCHSVTTVKGYRVGSIDTLLQYFYGYLMIYMYYEPPSRQYIIDHMKYMIYTFESHIHAHYAHPKQRFSATCYGREITREDIYKETWNKKPYHYRPVKKYAPTVQEGFALDSRAWKK